LADEPNKNPAAAGFLLCAKTWATLCPSQPTEKPMPWRTQTVKENNAQNSLPSPVSQMLTSANLRAAAASAARPSKWLNRDEMDDRPKNSPKRTPQRRNRVSVPCGDDHLASVGFLLFGNLRTRQKPQQRHPASFAVNAPKRT